MNNPLNSRLPPADNDGMDTLTIGDTTITTDGDVLLVTRDGVTVERRLVADDDPWRRIACVIDSLSTGETK